MKTEEELKEAFGPMGVAIHAINQGDFEKVGKTAILESDTDKNESVHIWQVDRNAVAVLTRRHRARNCGFLTCKIFESSFDKVLGECLLQRAAAGNNQQQIKMEGAA